MGLEKFAVIYVRVICGIYTTDSSKYRFFLEIEKIKENIISKLLLIIASGGFIRILKKVII